MSEGVAGPLAVVVMAKRPRAGRVKTRLIPPLTSDEAAALAGAMLADTLERIAAWAPTAGATVRLYLDEPADDSPDEVEVPSVVTLHTQRGDGLGARMLRALVETAASGARRVLIVGTDCPTLPTAFLDLAAEALAAPRTVVLGPTPDGGYYLLGLNEIAPALFAMDYSHDRVLADTLGAAAEAGLAPVVLPELPDVDDAASLDALAEAWGAGIDVGPRTAAWLDARA